MTFITSTTGPIEAGQIVCDNVDGVDISTFKADYDAKVDQDVKTTANPTFNNLTVND